jgi:DNA-binding MarR family transcriptional regulator
MNVTEEQLCTDLSRAFTLLRRRFDRAMTEQGASLAQTKILMCVKAYAGAGRAADIAEALDIAPRTVTEALDGLERDGMVQRVPDAEDRRVKRVALTPAGDAAIAVTDPLRRQLGREVMGVLDRSEREHLHAALQKILQGLSGN